jgi:hypothetical protein
MMAPLVALSLLTALAGCDRNGPYDRAGVWRPNHANESNLRAMVEVPGDLATATPAARADGGLAASAVARLRHDQVRPLMNSGLAQVVPVTGGEPAAAAAAAPAGGVPP